MSFSLTPRAGIAGLRPAAAFAMAIVLLTGCASPAQRFDAAAAALGLSRQIVPGTGFDHVVYRQPPSRAPSGALHVYLDGDGSPWLHERWIARDPTPRERLVLRLMAADPAPAVYLGRPCYHGLAAEAGCEPGLWTHRRYSEAVVASMAGALERLAASASPRELVLIGYSGGGALAMLLAARVPAVTGVLTVAANLDLGAWTALHGYSALVGSIDPAGLPALDARVRQVHVAGARDQNVPPALIRQALRSQPHARLEIVAGADHDCCWEKKWPSILGWIDGHP